MKIGILDIQGSVEEHAAVLKKLGEKFDIETVLVKSPRHIADIDGLIIPGGESTTVSHILESSGLFNAIAARKDLPVWGTCAGAILIAKKVRQTGGARRPRSLGLMEIDIERNGYGRQLDSFEASLEIATLSEKPFHGVFVRAPRVRSASKKVTSLAQFEGEPVMLRQGRYLATMFHPELTDDARIHEYFINEVCDGK